jgi:hypothetical protein
MTCSTHDHSASGTQHALLQIQDNEAKKFRQDTSSDHTRVVRRGIHPHGGICIIISSLKVAG